MRIVDSERLKLHQQYLDAEEKMKYLLGRRDEGASLSFEPPRFILHSWYREGMWAEHVIGEGETIPLCVEAYLAQLKKVKRGIKLLIQGHARKEKRNAKR